MAGATRNIMVRAGADFSAITKQSQKAAQSMKKMSTSIASSAGLIKKALGAIGVAVSLRAIISAAKDAKEAYDEQAEAQAKLAQVMHNTMGASADEVKSIKALCDAQQDLGVIAGDVQMAGAQELATYLEQTSTLKKLIPVMNDMAAQQYGFNATAESTTSIATMLGKVMNGQVNALSRYGYKFDEAQEKILKFGTEEQRAAVLAQVVEQSVGGMNQALANTPTGRLKQLKNTMEDIKAQFGQAVTAIATAFLPLLMKVASVLSTIAKIATRVAQSIANVFGKKLTVSTAAASSGAATAAVNTSAIADSMKDVKDKTKAAGKAAKEAAKDLMGFDELNLLSDKSDSSAAEAAADAAEDLGDTLGDLSDNVSAGGLFDFGELAEGFGWLERALENLKERIGPIVDDIKKIFGGLYDFIAGVFTGDWERAFDGLGNAVLGFKDLVNDVVYGLLLPAIDAFLDWLGEKTGTDLSGLKETIHTIVDDIMGIFNGLMDFIAGVLLGDWDMAFTGLGNAVSSFGKLVNDVISLILVPAFDSLAGFVIERIAGLIDWISEKTGIDLSHIKENVVYNLNFLRYYIEACAVKIGWIVQDLCDIVGSAIKGDWDGAWKAAQRLVDDASVDIIPTVTKMAQEATKAMMDASNDVNTSSADARKAVEEASGGIKGALDQTRQESNAFAKLFASDMGEAGSSATEQLGTNLVEGLSHLAMFILPPGLTQMIQLFVNTGARMVHGLIESASEGFSEFSTLFSGFADSFSTIGGNLVSALQNGFNGLWGSFSSAVTNLVSTLVGGISSTIQQGFSGLGSAIGTAVSDAGGKLQELAGKARSSIDTVMEQGKTSLNGIVNSIQNAVNNIISQANSILSRIRGKSYATGGFPEEGPFFMNRGEIAGKFSNGKSVVANNKQITDGIAAATYDAYMRALADSGAGAGSEQAVNVYIGDELVYTGYSKWNKRQQLMAGGRA